MFHSSTELLIDYWRGLRFGRPMPLRADIDPTAFPGLAPRAFVAVRETTDVRFRLAGEAVIELCRRQLAGESLLALWRAEHRGRVAALLGASLIAGEPMVIAAECGAEGALLFRLEMLLAPLIGPAGVADRFLGLCQPLSGAASAPLADLAIVAVNGHAAERAHLRLAAIDGRRIA
jgi:hypothetical protein